MTPRIARIADPFEPTTDHGALRLTQKGSFMSRTSSLSWWALPMLMSSALPAIADVRFTLTDLGTLGGVSSSASGIDDAGRVVGTSDIGGFTDHAFLWQAGKLQDLGTLGGSTSAAFGIDSAGRVVGRAGNAGQTDRAFFWQAGGMRDLLTLGGGSGDARAINSAGQVAGTAGTSAGDSHAFLWQPGLMRDLGTLGGRGSFGRGLNAAGQVVGVSFMADQSTLHGFLWQDSGILDLGALGGKYSAAWAINAAGQVVGEASTRGDLASHAFVWQAGRMQDLGTLGGGSSIGLAITSSGQVVGHSQTAGNAGEHAFLSGPRGGITDLNDLLVDRGGALLSTANGINESGQIVGTATIARQDRAVLLTPTGSIAWASGGAGGSFGDGAHWTQGFGPSRYLDAVIATTGGESVSMSADASVKSLVLGAAAGAAGRPELVLHMGTRLTAVEGVTVQATGTVTGNGTIAGAVTNFGTVRANNLTITGRFDNAGTVAGGGYLNASLNNAAAGVLQSGAGDVLRVAGASHVNGGLIDISGGGTLQYTGHLGNAAGGRILLNDAVLRLDDGASNAGQVLVSFGGATIYGAVSTQAGGKIVLSGHSNTTFADAVDVESGGELRVASGSTAVFFGPVHQRTGAIFSGAGAKFYEGGLSVGNSPGLGTDAGEVSFGGGNRYLEEIGGLAAGSQFDKYVVAGTLAFGGRLKVVWWDHFEGQAGQTFDLFDWGHASGTFAAIDLSGAPLAAGLSWDTSRLYSTGEISISAVPEPESWALLLAGLGLVAFVARRRRTALVFASTLTLLGASTLASAAGIRPVYVEQVMPARPYKASMTVAAASLPNVRTDDLVFVGGEGAIGITSIVITNPDPRDKSVTIVEPVAGLRGGGTPVASAPSKLVVMVAALATVQLSFPTPLVFSATGGSTCFGMQVNEFAGPVQVLLSGSGQ